MTRKPTDEEWEAAVRQHVSDAVETTRAEFARHAEWIVREYDGRSILGDIRHWIRRRFQ